MTSKKWYCIGLMSGTSLDGVDLVYVEFLASKNYTFKIIYSETINYSKKWINILKDAFYYDKKQLVVLDKTYGLYLSKLLNEFILKNNIQNIDFIASHGHTIHHKPAENYTLQIGNGQTIATKTKVKTVCNFRVQDVNFGGQGAPLVPIGDQFLFFDYDYCLNLGGFANISFSQNKERIAFDICPANIVLNHYVNKLGFTYDDKGKIARNGTISTPLLDALNKLSFYQDEKPKSLGFEFITSVIFPIIDAYNLPETTILKTFVEHIAIQIGQKTKSKGKLLITGGGTFNTYLIERITNYTSAKIIVPNTTIIDFKEALIFAFLGLRKLENKVNCLKSVTGASKNHSSGFVYLP